DATLTIIKDAVPNDAQDFTYSGTGTGVSVFSLDDDADPTLSNTKVFTFNGTPLGAKTLTEDANPAGWTLTNVACSAGGTATLATRTVSATLAAGHAVTTRRTSDLDATLTIIKDAVPNDAQDFTYSGTGTGVSAFSLDDDADPTLSNTKVFTFNGNQLGAKTVTEDANPAGWTLTNVACSAGGTATLATRTVSATLAAGDTVTCTYTNTKDATLPIVKDAVPNDAQDFTYAGTGTGVSA